MLKSKMANYIYNEVCRICSDVIPVETIYNETRKTMFNLMNGMTSKILNTTGFIDAQYCHVVTTNKTSLFRMLSEETNTYKREKLAKAITELDATTISEMIEAWEREQQDVTGLVLAVAAAATLSATNTTSG